jgi:hypothetical protein
VLTFRLTRTGHHIRSSSLSCPFLTLSPFFYHRLLPLFRPSPVLPWALTHFSSQTLWRLGRRRLRRHGTIRQLQQSMVDLRRCRCGPRRDGRSLLLHQLRQGYVSFFAALNSGDLTCTDSLFFPPFLSCTVVYNSLQPLVGLAHSPFSPLSSPFVSSALRSLAAMPAGFLVLPQRRFLFLFRLSRAVTLSSSRLYLQQSHWSLP